MRNQPPLQPFSPPLSSIHTLKYSPPRDKEGSLSLDLGRSPWPPPPGIAFLDKSIGSLPLRSLGLLSAVCSLVLLGKLSFDGIKFGVDSGDERVLDVGFFAEEPLVNIGSGLRQAGLALVPFDFVWVRRGKPELGLGMGLASDWLIRSY